MYLGLSHVELRIIALSYCIGNIEDPCLGFKGHTDARTQESIVHSDVPGIRSGPPVVYKRKKERILS